MAKPAKDPNLMPYEIIHKRSGRTLGIVDGLSPESAIRNMLKEAGDTDTKPDPSLVAVLRKKGPARR